MGVNVLLGVVNHQLGVIFVEYLVLDSQPSHFIFNMFEGLRINLKFAVQHILILQLLHLVLIFRIRRLFGALPVLVVLFVSRILLVRIPLLLLLERLISGRILDNGWLLVCS